MKLTDADKNFKVKKINTEDGTEWYDYSYNLFTLYGVFPPQNKKEGFYRIPFSVAENCNDGVKFLNTHTAGGRLRFKTNSNEIHIKAEMQNISKMSHMAFTGSIGFDLYEKTENGYKYINTFVPPTDIKSSFVSAVFLSDSGEIKDYTINFPLYSGVKSLQIGVKEGSEILKTDGYKHKNPIVYYGSSITQGGCASRPGNSYQSIVTRCFDTDHINLGFSGSAKGEAAMAEYISEIKNMSVFVCDYDHNAPSVEHLKNTLLPLLLTVRNKNKNLPIIIMSRPQPNPSEDDLDRLKTVKEAYFSMKNNGDENVYFIDGTKIMTGISPDSATVDNCHPNDFGFMCMAEAVAKVLKSIKLS